VSNTSPNEYRCDSCGWVYRAPDNDGVDIYEQPPGWACPDCQAEVGLFTLIVPTDADLGTDDDEFEPQADISTGPVIRTKSSNPDVETLAGRWAKKKLETQPDFQRYEVWPIQKRSRLVESVLLGLPIPLFYFAEEDNGTEIVIDGQQRLTSLFRFIRGEYTLKGLATLKKFNDKKFANLEEKHQDAINSFTLSIVTILKDSDPDVRFSMFERLNEGATKLNDQELRNSVFRGEYNDQLKSLSKLPEFWKLLKQRQAHRRMVDVELVLRFMAFFNQTYLKHPDKKTKEFLNREMEAWPSRPAKEHDKAAKAFKDAINSSLTVFGESAFRRYAAGSGNGSGKWETKFNRALYDVQMYGFSQHPRGIITKKADALREASLNLMSDPVFVDLISHTISEKKRVDKRFRMWLDMIDGILGDEKQGPRIFSQEIKVKLFEADPTCTICRQRIQIIDDAHVDHIVPFSKGGETTDGNAALTHRVCNLSKQAKDVDETG
jgi:rubredoxin